MEIRTQRQHFTAPSWEAALSGHPGADGGDAGLDSAAAAAAAAAGAAGATTVACYETHGGHKPSFF